MDSLFAIGSGKTMSPKARDGLSKTPFLRTSNVFWDEIDLTELDYMEISADELRNKRLHPGDLLVCEGGEIGRSAIWSGQVETISFQNHLHRLRPHRADVDPRFYVYFFQAAFTQLGIFEGAGNKTTIPNLSRNRLGALEVPHPPVREQVGIADALAFVRNGVRKEESIVRTAQELKQATMRELFTQGLRGEGQKETEIGLVPASWGVSRFENVREWLQYGTSVQCNSIPAKFPTLRIPNVEAAFVNVSDLKYCELPKEVADKYLLLNGDLLFIRTNGVRERLGKCAVYSDNPPNALFASYLIRARLLTKKVVPRYAAYFFSSELGTELVAGGATPAADGKFNLNTGAIDSILLPVPPTLDEQQDIVEILEAIDQKIGLHNRRKTILQELFQTLLHKLMTGEVLVSDLDLSAFEIAPTVEATI